MPYLPPQEPDINSKSKRKEDMQELQKLGESLLKLTNSQLAGIELPEILSDAITEAKSLTSNEAKRRQLQYIGKIMRDIDAEPIRLALERLQQAHKKVTQQFHHAEAWREKLISKGDDALNDFLNEYQDADRQQLRQLMRKAQHDRKTGKNTGGETALFRFLRGLVKEA